MAAVPAGAAPDQPPRLARYYDDWLLAVDSMILQAERRALYGLDDRQRELFIHAFWNAREKGTAARFHQNYLEAQRRFKRLHGDRAQATLLAGVPSRIDDFGGCGRGSRRLQVWTYTDWQARHVSGKDNEEGFVLVFYEPSVRRPGELKQWSRTEPLSQLMYRRPGHGEPSIDDLLSAEVRDPCVPTLHNDLRRVRGALQRAVSTVELRQRMAPATPDSTWLQALSEVLNGRLPAEATPEADEDVLEITFPGRYRQSTIIHGRMTLPAEIVERNAAGLLFDRLVLSGDVWQGSKDTANGGILVEPFQVVHHVAGEAPSSGRIQVDFYRDLRPGTYIFDLRLADSQGLALLRRELTIEVPRRSEEAEPPAGARTGFSGLLRPEVGVLTTFPSVHLAVDNEKAWAGEVEIVAVTNGGPIDRLDFLVDGAVVATDQEPPWIANLQLPPTPERHSVEVLALDAGGRVLARDLQTLNASPPRFAVRMVEPRRGVPASRIRLRVDIPAEESLVGVDLYAGEHLFATLQEAPFTYPMPDLNGAPFIRALGRLESGAQAEDVVFLSREPLEEIDVDLVQLYTSVTDADNRPVLGLPVTSFQIFEDDEAVTIERFDTVENLPINVTLLMDVSQSMRRRMEIVTTSALRFFEQVLTPKDQASVMIFNDDIRRLVPFTADVNHLRYGAAGQKARGSTRLHDSLVYSLHGFGGRDGKKAMVLLSDGEDVDSDFQFRQVLQLALRSGVAVYPIGLALQHEETRANLEQLARETGGRFFIISVPSELEQVYRQIEQDLRSQYLLTYRPPTDKARVDFRKVKVEVDGDSKARTIYGYYP